jgi:hypothetical protein
MVRHECPGGFPTPGRHHFPTSFVNQAEQEPFSASN